MSTKAFEERTAWQRYGLAAGLFALALLLRLVVLPRAGGFAFITFYPALIAIFYFCGRGPGWLFAAASALAALLLVPNRGIGWSGMLGKCLALALYLGTAGLLDLVVERARQATRRWREIAGALADSEKRHLGILQDQTDLICRTDAGGRMVYVNEAFCRFFGRSASEFIGQVWQPASDAEDRAHVEKRLAMIHPGQPVVSLETRVHDGEGQIAWMHFVNRGIFDAADRLVEIQSVGRDVTLRRDLEQRLSLTAHDMTDLYDNAPCGYHSLAPDGTFLNVNRRELDWLGLTREEVVGRRKFTDFLTAEGIARFRETFPRFLETGHVEDVEFDLVGADGSRRRVSVSANGVRDGAGRVIATRSVAHDITELHAVRSELTRLGAEQHVMLDNELVGIVKFREGRITWANRGAHHIFGHPARALLGLPAQRLYLGEASFQQEAERARPALERGAIYRQQIEMATAAGSPVWIDAIGVTLSAALRESMWIFADVSEMKAHQDKVEHIAFHDPLTGLPNRLLMRDRLDMALVAASRTGRHPAVCFIDLDGFKPINDRFGHEVGDRVLTEVAQRLASCLRANDTVARVGGDEFVVILDGLEAGSEGSTAIERLREAVALPYLLEGQPPLELSASIGVAQLPAGQATAELLLRLADAAMYEAKRLGKNRIIQAPAAAPASR